MANKPIKRNPPGCYVYEIVVDGIVRYIGKGTRSRVSRHLRAALGINRRRAVGQTVKARKFYNRLAKALRRGAIVEARITVAGLSSREAFNREIVEIASLPSDQLWNELPGGEGLSSEYAKRIWADPRYRSKMMALRTSDEFRQRAREKTVAHFASQKARDRSREQTKAIWADSVFREKHTKTMQSLWERDGFREKHKQAVAKAWDEHPERRAARAEISRSYSSKPEVRMAVGRRFKGLWKDPEFRKRATAHWRDIDRKKAIVEGWTPEFLKKRGRAIAEGLAKSEAHKKRFADPAERSRISKLAQAHWKNPTARARQSAKMKALWADPEHRAKTTAHWYEKRKLRGK